MEPTYLSHIFVFSREGIPSGTTHGELKARIEAYKQANNIVVTSIKDGTQQKRISLIFEQLA